MSNQTDELTATETTIERITAQLADLDRQRADCDQRIQQAQSDVAAIARAQEQRTRALESARAALATVATESRTVSREARATHGTIREARLVKALKTIMQQERAAEKALAETQKANEQADLEDRNRITALSEQVKQAEGERVALLQEQATTESARSRVHRELGEMRARAILDQISAHSHTIQQLLAAKVEQSVTIERGITDLATWPDLQEQLLTAYPEHAKDTMYNLVETMLHYTDLLLDGRQGTNALIALATNHRISINANLLPFWPDIRPTNFNEQSISAFRAEFARFLDAYRPVLLKQQKPSA